MRYIALLDRTENGAEFGVSFPDCPGCTAQAASEDKALLNAVPALAEWLHDADREGIARPEARSYAQLLEDQEVLDAIQAGGMLVSVPYIPEAADQAVRVNVSLDKELLKAIDDEADRIGLTRSGFLAAAAKAKISASL